MSWIDNLRDWLSGKKTYLVAIVGVLTALLAFEAGEVDFVELVKLVWAALLVIFMRTAVKKAQTEWIA